ncbi:MAG TPA: hypothetical protein VF820_02380 [Patescibacteria group bacterium]
MKTERVVLSVVAIFIGLLVAGVAFFIYQSTRSLNPSKISTITISNPTPTPALDIYLTVDSPIDESVQDTKPLTITGKTTPGATIIVTTDASDQVVTPATNGNYSITTTLDSGENIITLTAISQSGSEVQKTITVTYSTEDF